MRNRAKSVVAKSSVAGVALLDEWFKGFASLRISASTITDLHLPPGAGEARNKQMTMTRS
jgi:hypothetical protein